MGTLLLWISVKWPFLFYYECRTEGYHPPPNDVNNGLLTSPLYKADPADSSIEFRHHQKGTISQPWDCRLPLSDGSNKLTAWTQLTQYSQLKVSILITRFSFTELSAKKRCITHEQSHGAGIQDCYKIETVCLHCCYLPYIRRRSLNNLESYSRV